MRDLQTTANGMPVAAMPSLPPRVAALARAACSAQHPGQPVRWHLPAGWRAMDERDREDARRALLTFESILDPDAPFNDLRAEDARLGIVTVLVSGTAIGATGEESAGAKLDLFEISLRDIPAWAVAAAVARWARGEVPQSIVKIPQYQYTPAPQTIRELALLETAYARRAAEEARKVVLMMSSEEALNPAPRNCPPSGPLPPANRLRKM